MKTTKIVKRLYNGWQVNNNDNVSVNGSNHL
jgi:hypothetical protein